jgi:hypothetical protein
LAGYEELSLDEIARATGADLAAVKSRLNRARQNLRRVLEPLGIRAIRSASEVVQHNKLAVWFQPEHYTQVHTAASIRGSEQDAVCAAEQHDIWKPMVQHLH